MKWLEELKKAHPCNIIEYDTSQRMLYEGFWKLWSLDRLIAIAEGSECVECIHDGIDSYVDGCPLCFIEADMEYDRSIQDFVLVSPIQHTRDCPYSDDWKP